MIDTRHSTKVSEEDAKTDLYKSFYNLNEVKDLMVKGVEEYNKIHPRIKLSLYKVQLTRLPIHLVRKPIFSLNQWLVWLAQLEACPA